MGVGSTISRMLKRAIGLYRDDTSPQLDAPQSKGTPITPYQIPLGDAATYACLKERESPSESDYGLFVEVAAQSNPFLPHLLWTATKNAEVYFLKRGVWKTPEDRMYREQSVRAQLTRIWRDPQKQEDSNVFYVEVGGFCSGRLELRKMLEGQLDDETAILKTSYPHDAERIDRARRQIGIVVPMTQGG
ncbi:MAG: hypothetical protein HYX24_04460 [Candidatus Aenigmarchaeota archaeon]|nr:hypothetical protein [Candidatus Aenigmarchaeota archaeon]